MPRLLFYYLFKRIGFGVIVVQLALSVPVVLSYLLYQLPPAAVRGGLVIPALVGVTPTVAFITLPMAVGVATALEFARMASEGMIAVLYALRLSVWSICRPALMLAVGVTTLAYVLANFVAPYYSSNMQVNPYCGIQDPTNTILAAGVFTALELWRLSKGINQ